MEEWKDIKETGGQYQVSSHGRVKRLWRNTRGGGIIHKEKILTLAKISNGYLQVSFYENKKSKAKYVHRLVASAFLPNPNNYPQINHIDCNKQNNNVNNLEWCDAKHNVEEAAKNGLVTGGLVSRNNNPHYVLQLSMDNNPIRSFWNAHEASKITNISPRAIRAVVRNNNNNKSAGGYIWKDCTEEEYHHYKNGQIHTKRPRKYERKIKL